MEAREGGCLALQAIVEDTGPGAESAGETDVATASSPVEPVGVSRCMESGKKHRQGMSGGTWAPAVQTITASLQEKQEEAPPPPEAAIPAPEAPRVHRHGRHSHQIHRRCCCCSHCPRFRGTAPTSSSCGGPGHMRRRCGCRIGEYIFFLIPRKPLSPGAAFLFSLLEEASPRFRCAVDIGGTLAKLVFIEELGPHSAAAAAEAAAAAAAASGGLPGFARRDPQLAARIYAGTCDAALDLASPLLTIRGTIWC